jgi:hypothetical protein
MGAIRALATTAFAIQTAPERTTASATQQASAPPASEERFAAAERGRDYARVTSSDGQLTATVTLRSACPAPVRALKVALRSREVSRTRGRV